VEKQGDWIVTVLKNMREQGKTRINANQDAEQEWKKTINTLHAMVSTDQYDSPGTWGTC